MGTFAAMSDPGHAEPVVSSPAEVVSKPPANTATWPAGILNTSPRISDDGNVVVFDSMTSGTPLTRQVMIRDRTAPGVTTAVPSPSSVHPGLSGDGCVVSYSVPVAPSNIRLVAINRCSTPPVGTLGTPVTIATIPDPGTDGALPAPALSFDGKVIAWSTGTTVLRYVDQGAGAGYALANTIVPPLTNPVPVGTPLVTGPTLDLTSDGTRVVFVGGPGSSPYQPVPANVFLWTAATTGPPATSATTELVSATSSGQPGAGSSIAPSISGDGGIVTYQSDGKDLAATGIAAATAPFVVVAVGNGASRTSRVLASDASRPVVSTDGISIVYNTSTDVHLARSTGTPAFATVAGVSLSTAVADGTSPTGPSATGQALSANGSVGVFDSTAGATLVNDTAYATGTHVFARAVVEVTPPTTTTTTAPTTTVVRPTTTAPPPPTTRPIPSTTVPASTVPLEPVTPTTTSPPFRPSFPGTGSGGSGSSSGSSRPVGSSTVTFPTFGPIEEATFAPVGVDFSPTVVGAGRQLQTLALTNPTSDSIDVIDMSIQNDPDGAFTIVESTCAGASVPPEGQCTVTVAFAPVTLGASSASLVATLSDGSTATALLSGTGAPPPVLTVVPGVASSGQVVAVEGSGFPADLIVELTWLGSDVPLPIQVDANGSFVSTMIVLPHTPRGPATATVLAQTDQFSTVTGNVLITDTADRSSWVLTRSAGSSFVR